METGKFLERPEAAQYLTDKGLRTAKGTLQKWATTGGGPIYRHFGKRVVYLIEDLDEWAEKKLSPPRHSSSGISAHVAA